VSLLRIVLLIVIAASLVSWASWRVRMIREITSAEGKGEKFPLLLFFGDGVYFFSATQSNSSRRRCDEIGVFALDFAQHPAHRPVLCPWSGLARLQIRCPMVPLAARLGSEYANVPKRRHAKRA
jgi:hypothetical protein